MLTMTEFAGTWSSRTNGLIEKASLTLKNLRVALKTKKAMDVDAMDVNRFGVFLFDHVFHHLRFDTAHASTELVSCALKKQ